MAASLHSFSFNNTHLYAFLFLTILLVQQHVMQVDGQQGCSDNSRMCSKCWTKNHIFIYAFQNVPQMNDAEMIAIAVALTADVCKVLGESISGVPFFGQNLENSHKKK